jgi:hypothetical protein
MKKMKVIQPTIEKREKRKAYLYPMELIVEHHNYCKE